MKIGVLGGGSWGTALAILWARHGHKVDLWVRNPDEAERYEAARCNVKYLPDAPFPDGVKVVPNLEWVLSQNKVICMAIPLQAYRRFLFEYKGLFRDHHQLVLLSKGIELDTWSLSSQIVTDVLGEEWEDRVFVLSGPSFAKEVAEDKPTTVVLASRNGPDLKRLQEQLSCPTFRLYRNEDVIGVELGGALKNVIAIASGMVVGLELGFNTLAGLYTRGLAEIARLGVALGGRRETFAGLAGMGDLILTCTGTLSRNRRVGEELARGLDLETILTKLGMVAEGVKTCESAYELGKSLKVDLPITNAVYGIIYTGLSPHDGLRMLMSRSLKSED